MEGETVNDYSRVSKHEGTTVWVRYSPVADTVTIHGYTDGGMSAAIWLPMEMVEDLAHNLIGAAMYRQDPPDPAQEV